MPPEYTMLQTEPEPVDHCPLCHAPFRSFMRGLVQNSWHRFWGNPYCCIICSECKKIIGYENPYYFVIPRGEAMNTKQKIRALNIALLIALVLAVVVFCAVVRGQVGQLIVKNTKGNITIFSVETDGYCAVAVESST